MNQREKLKAQLDLIQEMKNQFPKDVFIPQGEDYASVQMERNDKLELRVYADFNQSKFEDDIDRQVDLFFSEFIYTLEKDLDSAIEEEESASFLNSSPVNESTIDELMNSIKTQLVNSIKK